jgi:hypothetical protein
MFKCILIFLTCFNLYAATEDRFIKLSTQSKTLYTAMNDGTVINPTWVREVPTGSGTSFTLSNTPINSNAVIIAIDGVIISNYSVSGTSVTLSDSLQTGQDIYAIYQK